jgi:hypothetical protein
MFYEFSINLFIIVSIVHGYTSFAWHFVPTGLMPSPKLVKQPWEKLNRYYVEETDVRDYNARKLPHLKKFLPENYQLESGETK